MNMVKARLTDDLISLENSIEQHINFIHSLRTREYATLENEPRSEEERFRMLRIYLQRVRSLMNYHKELRNIRKNTD